MHYLLFYDVVADYAERRKAFRAAHLEQARRAVERGELILGGALANPIDGAVLLFRGSSAAIAEAFAVSRPVCHQRLGNSVASARVDDGRGRGCSHASCRSRVLIRAHLFKLGALTHPLPDISINADALTRAR